ncbi:hypothetical protein PSP31120_03581 [Pandoraea sputorum]|uniref:Uncharacterized protein n=1 Tax=Pandoraea sputorum TaxID=93222 RepID=A0A5E5AW40_9BURK|nr:hypothetical protein PSP31121_00957 [Pandoraea sputorum]VVE82334.1 hypothetical protein PSP31120_03581 [Pandoraea sputorum]
MKKGRQVAGPEILAQSLRSDIGGYGACRAEERFYYLGFAGCRAYSSNDAMPDCW